MRKARNVAGTAVLGCITLALPGCGDPVPPAAQAGISIHLQEYDRNTMPEHKDHVCPPARHWVNVPWMKDKDPTNQPQNTSASDPGQIAVNNQDGNAVRCTVKPKGSGFDVTGHGVGYATNSSMMKISNSIIDIRIPQIGSGDSNATGTVSVQDYASLVPYQSSECSFSVSGSNLAVDAGKIWGRVHCENLHDMKSPDAFCLVDDGYFIFENCATQ